MRTSIYVLKGGFANQAIILANAFRHYQKNKNVFIDIESSYVSDRFGRKPLIEFIQILGLPIRNLNKTEILAFKSLRKIIRAKASCYKLRRIDVYDSYFQNTDGLRAVVDKNYINRLEDFLGPLENNALDKKVLHLRIEKPPTNDIIYFVDEIRKEILKTKTIVCTDSVAKARQLLCQRSENEVEFSFGSEIEDFKILIQAKSVVGTSSSYLFLASIFRKFIYEREPAIIYSRYEEEWTREFREFLNGTHT